MRCTIGPYQRIEGKQMIGMQKLTVVIALTGLFSTMSTSCGGSGGGATIATSESTILIKDAPFSGLETFKVTFAKAVLVGTAGTALPRPPASFPRQPRAGWLPDIGPELSASLSLFLPGTGQVLRREMILGAFFLSTLPFLGAFGWAAWSPGVTSGTTTVPATATKTAPTTRIIWASRAPLGI